MDKNKPKIDNNPGSLEPPRPDQRKNGTKIMGIVIAVVAAMGLVLYFSLTNGGGKTAKDTEPPRIVTEDVPLMASNEGHGVAILPPEVLAKTEALAAETETKSCNPQFTIVRDKKEEPTIDPALETLWR